MVSEDVKVVKVYWNHKMGFHKLFAMFSVESIAIDHFRRTTIP